MFSFHTHTEFCDGKSTIDQFCNKAIELGMESIAFTSHAPVPFENTFSLKFDKIYDYKNAVLEAKRKYQSKLNIYLGLEADYIPGSSVSFNEWRKLLDLDFVIGSVHLVRNYENEKLWFIDGPSENYHLGLRDVFNNEIQTAVISYFDQVREMIKIEKPDIVGHFDKVKMNNRGKYFDIDEGWYKNEIDKTIDVLKEYKTVVEINSRGLYKERSNSTFPGEYEIKKCVENNIPLTLASDSHHVDDLQKGFLLSLKWARKCGVGRITVYNGAKWVLKSITKN